MLPEGPSMMEAISYIDVPFCLTLCSLTRQSLAGRSQGDWPEGRTQTWSERALSLPCH